MENPRHLVAVFPAESNNFAIDAIHLAVQPKELPEGIWPPLSPLPGALDRLQAAGQLIRPGGRHARRLAEFNVDGLRLRMRLGTASGNGHLIGASVSANILRRLRARLISTGQYWERSLARGARSDNYIDPRCLAADVDLHRESLEEVLRVIEQARRLYVEKAEPIFGFRIEAPKASVSKIELTWDVVSPIAAHAVTAFDAAWWMTFVGAGLRQGFFDEKDSAKVERAMATRHRLLDAVVGTRVLRADASETNGHLAKMYVKTYELIRFETMFRGKRARRLLRHPLRMGSYADFEADLRRLAAAPYAALLEAQENLHSAHLLSLGELVGPFMRAGDAAKVLPILDAFSATSMFRNPDEEFSVQLGRLKDAGVVHFRSGVWLLTPAFAPTFKAVSEYLSRHAPSATTGALP